MLSTRGFSVSSVPISSSSPDVRLDGAGEENSAFAGLPRLAGSGFFGSLPFSLLLMAMKKAW
jgi:hypothetical protein